MKSDAKQTALDYAKKAKKEEVVKWFERGGKEEEEEYEDDVPEIPGETTAERRKRIKAMKAGNEKFASIAKKTEDKQDAVEGAASDDVDHGLGPLPVWDEIKACRAENRADLTCVKTEKETAVDPSLWHCRHVNNLKLRMPAGVLTQLPPQLSYLRSLTTLIVSHNSLTALPDELGKLLQLKNLELTDNKVEQFPEAIQNLEHLEVVDACRNALQVPPPRPHGPARRIAPREDLPLRCAETDPMPFIRLHALFRCPDEDAVGGRQRG